MGFLFKSDKNKKIKTVAIFDIGSGSIGGAIALIPSSQDSIPTILKSVRTEIIFQEELDFNVFLKDMLSALHTTATSLYDSKLGAPDEIVCILASPWYVSETRTIKISRKHPFVFTEKFASDLLKKEIADLTSQYQKKYDDINSISELMDHQVMNVLLNGYAIDNPIGVRTTSVELNMFVSLSPKVCLDAIRNILMKTFHNNTISFSSFMMSYYLAVRDKYISPNSYILLDIGGEITDIGIVSNGVLKTSLSFPFGRKTFFKQLCLKLDIELRDAEEIMNLFNADVIEAKMKNKVLSVLKSIEDTWQKELRQSIDTISEIIILPNTIFLTVDNDLKKWFISSLNNEEYTQSMIVNDRFTVVSLEGREFLNMCNVKDNICDPFLMIEAIATMRKNEK